ncbi:hydroxyisourate hydrolase [Mesorhizobium sp. CAU 1741]|uniref:hydroxyisourate hydrolase n=1 Tax=Mesorhizobium sp. CAU 1741 TaxID=3140366 RepID=UPI00325AE180
MAQAAGGKLTTHVLDTALGKPAAGMDIAVYRLDGQDRVEIRRVTTNTDGRCDAPLLEGAEFETGQYEIVFFAGDYLRAGEGKLPDPLFLDQIPIRFGMAEQTHYHVPLLVSPYGYSTYRGS